ncbi:MAG: hypothetical protein DHS80DRAFT_22525 [Piptocephalis tieghemiana]|nr:MAG: hypothetical protein DHS80DRAFT_22525 [Piptocephalis tieghemiana]
MSSPEKGCAIWIDPVRWFSCRVKRVFYLCAAAITFVPHLQELALHWDLASTIFPQTSFSSPSSYPLFSPPPSPFSPPPPPSLPTFQPLRRMKRGKRRLEPGSPKDNESSGATDMGFYTVIPSKQIKKRRKVHVERMISKVTDVQTLESSPDHVDTQEVSEGTEEEGEIIATSSTAGLATYVDPSSSVYLDGQGGSQEWMTVKAKITKPKKSKKDRLLSMDAQGLVPQKSVSLQANQSIPVFILDTANQKKCISTGDVRNAVLWCLGCGENPPWLLVRQRALIHHVLLLHVPMLTPDAFYSTPADLTIPLDPRPVSLEEFKRRSLLATMERATAAVYKDLPALDDYFSHVFPVKGPGDGKQVLPPQLALLYAPMTNKQLKQRNRLLAEKNDKEMSLERMCLSREEMVEAEYPRAEVEGLEEGWVSTKGTTAGVEASVHTRAPEGKESDMEEKVKGDAAEEGTKEEGIKEEKGVDGVEGQGSSIPEERVRIFAVDCEMCRTEMGQELTRISVLEFFLKGEKEEEKDKDKVIVQMDELVMPPRPILDYLTKFSGITAEMMVGITTTLEDVQRRLLDLISPRDVLVGHSLNSDLFALKLLHPRVIDTSLLYHHSKGPPYRPSLKWLAHRHLSRDVQTSGDAGHDSLEDAQVCVDLVKMKNQKGWAFGRFDSNQEPIFARIARSGLKSGMVDSRHSIRPFLPSLTKAYHVSKVDEKAKEDEVGQTDGPGDKDGGKEGEENVSKVASVSEGVEEAIKDGCDFIFAKIPRLLEAYDRDDHQGRKRLEKEVVKGVNEEIRRVLEAVPVGTAIFLTSGTGDHREHRFLGEKFKRFNQLWCNTQDTSKLDPADVYTDDDEKSKPYIAGRARMGVGCVAIKQPVDE